MQQSLDNQHYRGFVAFTGFIYRRRMMKNVGVPSVADPSVGLLLGYDWLKIILNSLFYDRFWKMGHRTSIESTVLLDSIIMELLSSGKASLWYADKVWRRIITVSSRGLLINGEWRNGSERNWNGEGVKSTEWLKDSGRYSEATCKSRQSRGV